MDIARKLERCLTKDEVQAMLEACSDPQDKAVIMLVFDAGLQVSELTSLTWEDVTDDAENPIKLRVTRTDSTPRQVLVERKLWNKYVAPLFFAGLEGGAAGCTSTPAEPRIFPVSVQRLHQTIEEAAARVGFAKKVSSQR
jgi:integrase